MIKRICGAEHVAERSIDPSSVHIWGNGLGGSAVVTSTVALEDNEAGQAQTFRNVKVFIDEEGKRWRCSYWQVTRLPPP